MTDPYAEIATLQEQPDGSFRAYSAGGHFLLDIEEEGVAQMVLLNPGITVQRREQGQEDPRLTLPRPSMFGRKPKGGRGEEIDEQKLREALEEAELRDEARLRKDPGVDRALAAMKDKEKAKKIAEDHLAASDKKIPEDHLVTSDTDIQAILDLLR